MNILGYSFFKKITSIILDENFKYSKLKMEYLLSLIKYCDDFDESRDLKDFHFHEKYDSQKEYPIEVFKFDYGYGNNLYEYKILKIFTSKGETKEFIIADILLERSEWKKMAKYCQCDKCRSPWYDIPSLLLCRKCIGCMKGSRPKKNKINLTKKYIINKNLILR